MIEDFLVPPKSAKQIEAIALAWRDAFGITDSWAPAIVSLIETRLPRLFRPFSLIVRPDDEMGDAEAYTEFNPPHIAVRESVYRLASINDGRSRMTFSHEFGHLVLHPGAVKLRVQSGNQTKHVIKPYESAEWQARKFAAYFLLPTHIVRQFSNPSDLAEACQVSLQAAQIRFDETCHIKKITPECVSELIEATASRQKLPKPRLVK